MAKRIKKHPTYYAIPAYQILERLSDEEVAKELNMTVRTYKDKVNGFSDFKQTEVVNLSRLLRRSAEDIFLT